MAFTNNQFQWVLNKTAPVVDETQATTNNQFQWVFGLTEFVLDETAGVVIVEDMPHYQSLTPAVMRRVEVFAF